MHWYPRSEKNPLNDSQHAGVTQAPWMNTMVLVMVGCAFLCSGQVTVSRPQHGTAADDASTLRA